GAIREAEAMFRARAGQHLDGFEVWDGKRFVYRLPPGLDDAVLKPTDDRRSDIMRSFYRSILSLDQTCRWLTLLRDRIGHFVGRRAHRVCPLNPSDLFGRAVARSRPSYTFGLVGTILTVVAPAYGQTLDAKRIPIAVADLDYADTSGEVRNQQAEHEARL